MSMNPNATRADSPSRTPPTTLPTAELHLHLEGTLEPELIFELAAQHSLSLSSPTIEALRDRYQFNDLQSFLDLYYENLSVLRSEQDFAALTHAYLRRAQAAGVLHAEIFFDPQAHLIRGIPLDAALNGVAGALADSHSAYGMSSGLIVTFLRDRPVAEAQDVLEQVLASDATVLGIGLDSAEVGYPPRIFAEVFDRARAAGLQLVAHAGEEGPPEYIWEALDILGVSRIDHGIRCLEDPALVDRLVADQIPLTVCPLSNVRLRTVNTLADHPLVDMLQRGLLVTVNSDDPAYFGGYVDDNYAQIAQTFHLHPSTLAQLARNGVQASFLENERKTEILAEIDGWEARSALALDLNK